MHVLILPSWYFDADTNSISGRMFHQLAASLRKQDVDARILYARLHPKAGFRKKIKSGVEDGVPTWRMEQWSPPKLTAFLIKAWIKKYHAFLQEYISTEGKPHIIHAHGYMAGMVAAAAKENSGIPFIVTERLSAFITGDIRKAYQRLIVGVFSKADLVTVVSPGLKQFIQPYSDKNIEVIPNFFDPHIFYPGKSEITTNKFTFVSVGEPAFVKGIDLLIEALSLIKANFPAEIIHLVLADHIPEQETMQKIIDRNGLSNQISWTGLMSQAEVADLLRQSHVLISASRVETFGKAIMEALACGLPVIATKTIGAEYVVSSSTQGILVTRENPAALAEAMLEMKKDFYKYDAAQIADEVSKRFREDIVIDQWKKTYNRVLA